MLNLHQPHGERTNTGFYVHSPPAAAAPAAAKAAAAAPAAAKPTAAASAAAKPAAAAPAAAKSAAAATAAAPAAPTGAAIVQERSNQHAADKIAEAIVALRRGAYLFLKDP